MCLIVCGCLGLPLATFAQSNAAAQCPQEASARAGIDQCKAANAAAGIPPLESGQRNTGYDVLPRDGTTNFIRATHGHAKGG
jgi:hypothetical protein